MFCFAVATQRAKDFCIICIHALAFYRTPLFFGYSNSPLKSKCLKAAEQFQHELDHIAENLLGCSSPLAPFAARDASSEIYVLLRCGRCACVWVRYNRAYIKYLYGVRAQRLFVALKIQGLCVQLEMALSSSDISKCPFSGFPGFGKSCGSTGTRDSTPFL